MNEYLRNLNRIEFVVTSACTGKCKHCSQGDHRGTENINKAYAADAVYKIANEYNIKSVMTFGGEALLYPETVCEIHRAAKEMNIPKRQLITNGFFTNDYEKIHQIGQALIENGVNEILISADAFHQETIPLEYVISFAKAVNHSDITLKLNPAWLISPDHQNTYNIKTKEILKVFTSMGIEIGEGNVIFPSGNALKYFSDYFDLTKENTNPYQQNPRDIRAICFSANGDILGSNLYREDISEILSSYKPE